MALSECPNCRNPVAIDESLAGAEATCSHCGVKMYRPHGERAVATSPVVGEKQAAQSIESQQREAVSEAEVSQQDEQVLAELVRLQNQQPSWGGAILVLVVSLGLFLGAERADGGWEGLVMLVAVLALHESGHYVAMRWFGYRNLRMFFIPFFGAAVSGRHYNIAGWKKALVALAGPVPGILIGVPLGVLGLALEEPKLIQVALVLLILNGFNLLPFLPLDGGWVAHAVLFVRHPVLDVVFRVVAALAMVGLGLLTGGWMLIGVGLVMLIGVPLAWRLAKIAHRLRKQGMVAVSADAQSIPLQAALTILAEVRPALPAQATPKMLAQNVTNVFEALNAAPPGALATLGLLGLHAASFLLALVMSVAFSMLR